MPDASPADWLAVPAEREREILADSREREREILDCFARGQYERLKEIALGLNRAATAGDRAASLHARAVAELNRRDSGAQRERELRGRGG
jgi:hypothetical protein